MDSMFFKENKIKAIQIEIPQFIILGKNGQINLALFTGEIPAVQSFYGFISKKEVFFTSYEISC